MQESPDHAARAIDVVKERAQPAELMLGLVLVSIGKEVRISQGSLMEVRQRPSVSPAGSAILPLRPASRSNINRNMARAASGSELAISSSFIRSASIVTCDGPLGAIQPYSVRCSPNRVDELGSLPHQ